MLSLRGPCFARVQRADPPIGRVCMDGLPESAEQSEIGQSCQGLQFSFTDLSMALCAICVHLSSFSRGHDHP